MIIHSIHPSIHPFFQKSVRITKVPSKVQYPTRGAAGLWIGYLIIRRRYQGNGGRFVRWRDLVGEVRVDSYEDVGGVTIPPPLEDILLLNTASARD